MQVRLKKDVSRALRIAAVKADKTVPATLDSLLHPILFGRSRKKGVK